MAPDVPFVKTTPVASLQSSHGRPQPQQYFCKCAGHSILHPYKHNKPSKSKRGTTTSQNLPDLGLGSCMQTAVASMFHLPLRAQSPPQKHFSASSRSFCHPKPNAQSSLFEPDPQTLGPLGLHPWDGLAQHTPTHSESQWLPDLRFLRPSRTRLCPSLPADAPFRAAGGAMEARTHERDGGTDGGTDFSGRDGQGSGDTSEVALVKYGDITGDM